MKIRKYGKPGASLIKQKQFFFDENDKYIEEQKKSSNVLINSFKGMMLSLIDKMQLELDKSHCSSEVHFYLKENNLTSCVY